MNLLERTVNKLFKRNAVQKHYSKEQLVRAGERAALKVKKHYWNERNKDVRKAIDDYVVQGVPLERRVHEKMNYIVDQYESLLTERNISSHEFSFFFVGAKGQRVIDDVVVAPKQTVYSGFVAVDGIGMISLHRELKEKKQRLLGHGHSHGAINVFFSDQDERTFERLHNDHSYDTVLSYGSGAEEKKVRSKVFPALVTNRRKEQFAKIRMTIPTYTINNKGIVNVIRNTTNKEIAFNQIIGSTYKPSEKEAQTVKHDLLNRITIAHLNKKLIDIPTTQKSVVLRKDGFVKKGIRQKRQEYKPAANTIDKPVLEVTTTTGIEARLEALQEKYVALEKEHENVLRDNYSLRAKNAYLETKPITKSYTKNMQSYTRKLHESNEQPEQLLSTMAKLLSGQYKGSIDQVVQKDYREDELQTRIWKWEDRMKAVTQFYTDNKEVIDEVNTGYLDSLKETLHKNYYFRKHHEDKMDDLDRLFLNIKRKTLSSPQAFDQKYYTASTEDVVASSSS